MQNYLILMIFGAPEFLGLLITNPSSIFGNSESRRELSERSELFELFEMSELFELSELFEQVPTGSNAGISNRTPNSSKCLGSVHIPSANTLTEDLDIRTKNFRSELSGYSNYSDIRIIRIIRISESEASDPLDSNNPDIQIFALSES